MTIECPDCGIPFDRMSSYGEAELLARVHDRLWHRGGAEATVVVLDLAGTVTLRLDPPTEAIRLAS